MVFLNYYYTKYIGNNKLAANLQIRQLVLEDIIVGKND